MTRNRQTHSSKKSYFTKVHSLLSCYFWLFLLLLPFHSLLVFAVCHFTAHPEWACHKQSSWILNLDSWNLQAAATCSISCRGHARGRDICHMHPNGGNLEKSQKPIFDILIFVHYFLISGVRVQWWWGDDARSAAPVKPGGDWCLMRTTLAGSLSPLLTLTLFNTARHSRGREQRLRPPRLPHTCGLPCPTPLPIPTRSLRSARVWDRR